MNGKQSFYKNLRHIEVVIFSNQWMLLTKLINKQTYIK